MTTHKTPAEVLSDLAQVSGEFISTLDEFSSGTFNTVAGDNDVSEDENKSWTPAQAGRHIEKSITGFTSLLEGKTIPADRDPSAKLPVIANDFLNYDTKMISPDFLVPEDKVFDKERLVVNLRNSFDEILAAGARLDLTPVCLGFELPGYGPMTRLEWLFFVYCHTSRHLHQLQGMKAYFTERIESE